MPELDQLNLSALPKNTDTAVDATLTALVLDCSKCNPRSGVVFRVSYAMWRESWLPNIKSESEFVRRTIREATIYTLHRLLKRDFLQGRENCMKMVWHDHEFV